MIGNFMKSSKHTITTNPKTQHRLLPWWFLIDGVASLKVWQWCTWTLSGHTWSRIDRLASCERTQKHTLSHTYTHVHTNRHTTQTDISQKQSNPSNPPPKQNTLVTPCDSVIAVSVMCLFIGNTIYGRWFNIETKICEVNSELLLLVSNYGRWSLRVN